jgi:hypothetical protein
MPLLELGPNGPFMPVDRRTLKRLRKRFGSAKQAVEAIFEAYLPTRQTKRRKKRKKVR